MSENKHIVKKEEETLRIDKLLASFYTEKSRSEVQHWIKTNHVKVNGQSIKANYRCIEGDIIEWILPEEKEITIKGEDIPLSVVYEDEALLVINKPSGMVVHPSPGHMKKTLVHALLYYSESLSTIGGEQRPGIVHRLDKDTSGLLVVAKTNDCHQNLLTQFKNHSVKRTYEAVVYGVMEHNQGMIDAPIGRDPKKRQNMTVLQKGKEAITHFQVIHRYQHFTHVECQLETGRTHQIRVHMKYIGHPVFGDPKYGPKRKNVKNTGQVLHAKMLQFIHPKTGEELTFKLEPPKEFHETLEQVKKMV